MKPASNPHQVLPKPAVVAVLGGSSEKRHRPAQLIETDSRWMTLHLEECVPPGTPLRVDVEGGLVLGTVVAAESSESGAEIRVEIDQIIPDTVGLSRLVSAVLGQRLPPPETPKEQAPSESVRPGLRPGSR